MDRENLTAYTCVIAARMDNRDFARLLLYWNKQGESFTGRSALINHTIQQFLIEHSVEEITHLRAGEILSDERYIETKRQKSISYIVERAQQQMHDVVEEALKKSPQQVLLEDVLQEIPTEPSSEPDETLEEKEGEKEDERV